MNKVVLIGRAVREPELRKTGAGTDVAVFTLAVDNNTKEKSTSFLSICTYGKLASEVVAKFVRKGLLLGISGRLNQRVYEKEDGEKINIVEVICEDLDILEKKPVEEPKAEKSVKKSQKK